MCFPDRGGQEPAQAKEDTKELSIFEKQEEAVKEAKAAEQAAAADSFAAQDNDGIYADEYPTLDRIGTALNKIEFPIMGKPLEGTGRYLQRFGEPRTKWQQLKDAYGAAFDFL